MATTNEFIFSLLHAVRVVSDDELCQWSDRRASRVDPRSTDFDTRPTHPSGDLSRGLGALDARWLLSSAQWTLERGAEALGAVSTAEERRDRHHQLQGGRGDHGEGAARAHSSPSRRRATGRRAVGVDSAQSGEEGSQSLGLGHRATDASLDSRSVESPGERRDPSRCRGGSSLSLSAPTRSSRPLQKRGHCPARETARVSERLSSRPSLNLLL